MRVSNRRKIVAERSSRHRGAALGRQKVWCAFRRVRTIVGKAQVMTVSSNPGLTLLIISILCFEPFVFNRWDDAVL